MSGGWVLGLNPGAGGYNHHDPAAALLRHGRIVHAVEEERFLRVKGAPGAFPARAAQFCLDEAGISFGELDAVAVGYSPQRRWDRLVAQMARVRWYIDRELAGSPGIAGERPDAADRLASLGDAIGGLVQSYRRYDTPHGPAILTSLGYPDSRVPVEFVEHHLAHAASAYYPSQFERATAIVIDGVGEVACATAWHVADGEFVKILELSAPNSFGYLYAAVTDYLGFRAFEGEGKLMALAPYGGPNPVVAAAFKALGSTEAPPFDVAPFVAPSLASTGMGLDLERSAEALADAFGRPPRRSGEPLDDMHRDIAWATQDFLERAVLAFATDAVALSGESDVCVAGGVFLNCKLNQVLRESGRVRNLFVQPASGDAGLSIGAALRVSRRDSTVRTPLHTLALGPVADIDGTDLARWNLPFEEPDDLADEVAEMIADGAIVLWCRGPAELGPRALGHRSILADPRRPEMRDRVNEVKQRETWRPFAPAILEDHAASILEQFPSSARAPFMIEAYRVRDEWRSRIPAVVHVVDGTARPQTVSREHEPDFYGVIERFFARTGVPVLLNTSLNGRGEPLANTAQDALKLFYTCGAEALVLGRYLIRKTAPADGRPRSFVETRVGK